MTITINQKEYKIGFDFAVICEYEALRGKILDFSNALSPTLRFDVMWCVLKSFNEGEIPNIKELQHNITLQEFASFNAAINPLIEDFYILPESMKEEQKEDESPNQ